MTSPANIAEPALSPDPDREPSAREPPMIYVSDGTSWEYKVLVLPATAAQPAELELNALGKQGWELIGVLPERDGIHFFFKRVRA